ncbi:MAG: hypothetical protein OHK0046_27610 [Anaerolineae bacterium]
MTRFDTGPQLLTPPREEEEIYPYRRVWRSIILEIGLYFAIAAVLSVLAGFLGLGVPPNLRPYVNLALVLLPAVLWWLFSRIPEARVLEPRTRLVGVFVISALVANAITVPILNFIAVDQWLSGAETVDRWIGYTVTFGVIHEIIKYVVVRYSVWPGALRTRLDAVAYYAACAVGYTTVLNLQLAYNPTVTSDVVAGRAFGNLVIQLIAGIIMAYGLAEVRFNPRSLLLMPLMLLLAAAVHGIATPTRTTLVNAGFVLGIATTRPLFALVFSVVLVAGLLLAMIFLFTAAERREREVG